MLLKTELTYSRRSRMVESRAKQIKGVLEAATSPAGVLRIEYDRLETDEAAIWTTVQKIGVRFL